MGLRRGLERSFSSLRSRNFRLFFCGQLVSNSGNWLTTIALTLLVLHRTGSGTDVGFMAACQYGPILLLSAWAGLIADRSNKRHLLYITQSLEMVESFVLAALAFSGHAPLWAFYLTAAAGGGMLAFDNPGRRSFVSEMVGPKHLTNAVTLYSAMVNMSRIVGPAVGGLLIISVGYGWCFTVDGLSYLAVLGALVAMRDSELRRPDRTPRAPGQVRAGLRYVWSTPILRTTFLMLLLTGTLSYNFQVVLPLFVEKGLHGSGTQYTLVYSAFSAGAVLSTIVVARRRRIGYRELTIGAAAFGVTMGLLAASPGVSAAYGLGALVGAVSITYMTGVTAIVQLESDRSMVGRVLALQTVLQIGTTPIGGPVLGAIADAAGGRVPVMIGGAAALAASLVGVAGARRAERRSRPGQPSQAALSP